MYILSAKDWLGTAIDSMYTDKLYSYTDKLDAGYEKKKNENTPKTCFRETNSVISSCVTKIIFLGTFTQHATL